MQLTLNEYEVLSKIADKSKMDCWFYIERKPSGDDVILDLENNEELTLADGVYQLYEGMTEYSDYGLSKYQVKTFEELLEKLEIETE